MLFLKIFWLLALTTALAALSVDDFKPAMFHTSKPSGFYTVDTGTPNSGQILALADLNGDKYTDYIATNNRSAPKLSLFYWNDVTSTFEQQELSLATEGYLSELLVCDLNADGINELLLTYLANQTFQSKIYGTNCPFTCSLELWNLTNQYLVGMTAIPFIFDRFSNGSVSIFTFKGSERMIVTIVVSRQEMYTQFWGDLVTNAPANYPPVHQHFASMIDVNGDCFADIVLVSGQTSSFVQIYIKNHNNRYDLKQMDIGKNISWLSFEDLNADGASDLLFISWETGRYILYIIRNLNIPGTICQSFDSPAYQSQRLEKINLPQEHILLSDTNIKIADFNFDGYPDFLGIFQVNSYRTATILINQAQESSQWPAAFQKFQENTDALEQVGNPYQTCLYDFTQSGKVSVLVVSKVTKADGTEGMPRTSIINNVIEDSLFIKILPLLPSSSPDFEAKEVVNAIGVTIQWRITKLNGDKSIRVLNQKFQWNFGTLQLPFSTGGLGRTNNYIQDLTVGYPGFGMRDDWTPIIPNSQLIVLGRDEEWKIETLLKDNSRVYDMIYVSIVWLLGMGLLIGFLNWRENQEDKRDHYNFIQMIR